jgi:ATP-dependent Clp protease ATP-binding subunit ClpC
VSRLTGIPVSSLTQEEKERLLGLEAHLHRRVVGQEEAVSVVSEAVLRSRAGLASPDRPIGSFLFLGPTGVGKTEMARALAEALFGSEDRMVRLDMSEYQERHTVSRLVGAPPGSDAIIRRGAGIGFGTGVPDADEEARREQILRPLRDHFRPEFLNRIDEIVVFRQLTAEQLRQITELLLEQPRRLLHAQGVAVEFTDPAVDWLAQRGYQPEYGARPLRRTIQREVDNQLSRLLLDGQLGEGSRVTVDVADGRLAFHPEGTQDNGPGPRPASAG